MTQMDLPQKSEIILGIGSVQGAVATWSTMGVKIVRRYRMLITDQVATAPCTDPIQVRRRLLRQPTQIGNRQLAMRLFIPERDQWFDLGCAARG